MYRSGHNEPDSKSGSSVWARGFESHHLRHIFLITFKNYLIYLDALDAYSVFLPTVKQA